MLENWSQLSEKLDEDAAKYRIPLSGQFEITARCNLQCKMCYVCRTAGDRSVMERELTAAEWIHLAEEAKSAGMLNLLITGGEAFLRKDFRQIYEALAEMGLHIKIYTNGTLITPKIAKWLGKIPPKRMDITLYGASPETYQRVTGNGNAYYSAIRGVDLLLSEGIQLGLRTTVIRDNADDYHKLLSLAEERDLLLKFVYYISDRRGEKNTELDSLRLSPLEIARYEARAGKDYARAYKKLYNGITSDTTDYENKVSPIDDYAFRCNAGKSEFWITWDGKMSACGVIDEAVAEPMKLGFSEAWNSLTNFCNSISPCTECRECLHREYCWTCPARLKIETGHYDKPAPYICEWAKYRGEYFMESSSFK